MKKVRIKKRISGRSSLRSVANATFAKCYMCRSTFELPGSTVMPSEAYWCCGKECADHFASWNPKEVVRWPAPPLRVIVVVDAEKAERLTFKIAAVITSVTFLAAFLYVLCRCV